MKQTVVERRASPRYSLRLPLRYRVSQKHAASYSGTGITQDLSIHGISFHCRKPLPVGAHVDLLVDWPAKYGDLYPIELHATGLILRSEGGKTAVSMTSHRLRVSEIPTQPVLASA